MALKALAAAATLIACLGMAATADARCGGKSFSAGSSAGPQNSAVAEMPQAASRQDATVWTPATASPGGWPIVSSDADGLDEYRRAIGRERIPVDANGMPRRRC